MEDTRCGEVAIALQYETMEDKIENDSKAVQGMSRGNLGSRKIPDEGNLLKL